MKRSALNFWIDAVTGVAFLVCAVSGIVFLLPLGVRGVSASGVATIMGVSVPAWHAVHDWSAVTIVVGLGLHCALHYRWIVTTGRRVLGGLSAAPRAPQRTDPGAQRPRVASTPAPVTVYRATGAVPVSRDLTAEPRRSLSPRSGAERRYTRGAFLTGAAGLAGGALLAGLIAARGRSPGAATRAGLTALNDGSGGSGSPSGYGNGGDDLQSGDYAYGYGGGSQPSGGSAPPSGGSAPSGGGSSGARVSVDAGACVGCGACLEVCPAGVFSWSGGKATASSPGSCIRCGRCLQACPVGAITVAA